MTTNGHAPGSINGGSNGAAPPTPPSMPPPPVSSRLPPADPDAVQDLLCVGFGPASLAVAVALHDALAAGTIAATAAGAAPPKVLFLEKQPRFAWHAGMLLPGAKMQISFLKDLATLRDPRSAFTFVHYLHQHGRLVEFANLGTFLPARAEYEDYLRWCARAFDGCVAYGSEVVSVGGGGEVTDGVDGHGEPLATFRVVARHPKTGGTREYRARNVLVALGGQPALPAALPAHHARVVHSSQYAHRVPALLGDRGAPYRVAVVGAGQSAAEIVNNIQEQYPRAQTALVMRSAFLRPSDDSPFVNSIFNPAYVDCLYPRPARARRRLLAEARPTNYGVVRLDLIEALYERMYHQRRVLGPDERTWPHRLLGGRQVVRVEVAEGEAEGKAEAEAKAEGGASPAPLRLFVRAVEDEEGRRDGPNGHAPADEEELPVDLIVAATGYQRNAHVDLLRDLWPLLPDKAAANTRDHDDDDDDEGWDVRLDDGVTKVLRVARDYHVGFAPGRVAPGSGVWLQGCCEDTHGLSDTLLSVLATRSGEIVQSIFGAGSAL